MMDIDYRKLLVGVLAAYYAFEGTDIYPVKWELLSEEEKKAFLAAADDADRLAVDAIP